MSEETKEQVTIIRLDQRQFKDLIITIDYLRDELKFIGGKLNLIEGEIRLLRIEIMDKKGKLDEKVKK